MKDLKSQQQQQQTKNNDYSDIVAGNSCLDGSEYSSRSPGTSKVVAPASVNQTAPPSDIDHVGDGTGNGQPPHILHEYRQTKAFQTLLRRQAQAVRKI